MEKLNKYFTSACGANNGNFLQDLGFVHTRNIEEADVIIFGGGADVDPSTYGEEASDRTWTSPQKEKIEKEDFMEGIKLGKKMLGICRGIQFICAMAGGKLIQDVSGHSGSSHTITTFDGVSVNTNSIHHQMVNPYTIKDPRNYKVLAWSSKRRSNRYLGPKDKSILLPWNFKEIESIYFPKISAIGFQFHPEMMHKSSQFEPVMDWTKKTLVKFFNNEL